MNPVQHTVQWFVISLTLIGLMFLHGIKAQAEDPLDPSNDCWEAKTNIGCLLFTNSNCVWFRGPTGYYCAPNIMCDIGPCSLLDDIWHSSW